MTRCPLPLHNIQLPATAAGAPKNTEKADAANYGGHSGPGSYNYGFTPSWSGRQSFGRTWQG